MARELTVFATRGELAGALATRVAAELDAAIGERGRATLAVSGGTTPALFFRALSDADIDWTRVTITLVDERFVPPSSDRSNEGLARRDLLIGRAGAASFAPLYAPAESVEGAADLAQRRIAELPRPLDAVILGMGDDGHTASFFPDADNLAALLDPAQKRLVMPVHAPSGVEPRLTLTLPAIASARFLALHIEGPAKRAALDRALSDAGPKLPIRVVLDHAATAPQIFWAPNEG